MSAPKWTEETDAAALPPNPAKKKEKKVMADNKNKAIVHLFLQSACLLSISLSSTNRFIFFREKNPVTLVTFSVMDSKK